MKTELAAKCPATTLCYSVARIARPVSDTFQKRRKLETRPVDAQSVLLQKDKKRRKRKGEKKIKKNEKTKDVGHFLESRNFDFCTCPSKQEQRGATEKKDTLSSLSRLELIWPISSMKISNMSKNCDFSEKLWTSMDYRSQVPVWVSCEVHFNLIFSSSSLVICVNLLHSWPKV